MKDYIDIFIDYLRCERNYSSHTVSACENDLLQFAGFLTEKSTREGEVITIDIVDADIVREWLMVMVQHSYKPSTVNRRLSSLRSFFKYLMRRGVVSKHPLLTVASLKKARQLPSFLKESEMEEVLDSEQYSSEFEAVRDRLVLEMLYETGMRRSELVGLRDMDVDMNAQTIKVTGKRNKQRILPFGERLKEMLMYYINVRDRMVLREGEMLFVRKDGQQITPSIVYYIVKKRLCGKTMLAKRSPHVLRHTFATSMLNDGADIGAVRDLLGHGSLASTAVYTHLTFQELKKMYNAHPRAKK